MVSSIVRSPNWRKFEERAATLYAALGYKVEHNVNVSGQQCDLVCKIQLPGAGVNTLYVDCKYTEDRRINSVSNQDVDNFAATFLSRRHSHGWTQGVLLSNRPFSQNAKAAAQAHHGIVLKTITELENDLFGVQSYLRSSIEEGDTVAKTYVKVRVESLGESPNQETDLMKVVSAWLKTKRGRIFCILGDFGVGKSTFMQFLHRRLALSYSDGRSRRIPLLMSLRDFADVKDGVDLVHRFLRVDLNALVGRGPIKTFVRRDRFVFLLDGFDEMGKSSDAMTRRRNFFKIAQLAALGSRVILTCRPAYFVSQAELEETFGMVQSDFGVGRLRSGTAKVSPGSDKIAEALQSDQESVLLESLIRDVKESAAGAVVHHVALFVEPQIRMYLRKHDDAIAASSDGQLDADSLYARILDIYDLRDLAQRPILLKLMVDTLPRFRRQSSGAGFEVVVGETESVKCDEITPYLLYHAYTESEMRREYGKGESRWLMDRKNKRRLIAEIARRLLDSGSMALDPKRTLSTSRRH